MVVFSLSYRNKIIMSDCRAHPYDAKRLHTDSNLKTNTSFEFAHSSQFQFVSHLPSLPSQLSQQTPSSHVYFGEGNHSTISLQPTVTPSAAVQFMAMMEMVRFLSSQAEERKRRIQGKRGAINRLEKAVLEQEWRVKTGLEHFGRRKEALQAKRARVQGIKKKKLRVVTEDTERVELEVNCMLRGLRVRNASRSFIDRRDVHQESSLHQQQLQRHQQNRRRKIYVPIPMPYQQHPYYPPHNAQYHPYYPTPSPFVHSQTQIPPWAASPKQDPSRFSLPNYNSHKLAQQDKTVQKQPILIEQLRQALTMKFKQPQNNAQLDYFDPPSLQKSRQGQEDGRKSETPTPKSAIRRSSSIKWRRDDAEDKELVEIIQKSIKHIKTQHTDEQITKKDPQRQTPNKPIPQQPRVSPVRPLRNNTSDSSSIINITYDSQDKRNSKSFEREGESKIGKGSSRASERKSDHLRQIQQSNVKIEMVDMSHSKNSNSSQSDSSRHRPNKHTAPLANHFQQIEEESQEMASLKVTPCENHGSRNSKRQQSPKLPLIRPLLPEEQQDGEDDILKSIKLDTESRISRNLFANQSQQLPPEDDFLQGITLLKESKASREKGLSLKGSALGQDCQEQSPQREKGSQSEIFSKDHNQLDEDFGFDSTLRLSTKSRIAKPGKSIIRTSTEGKEALRRGQTQPLKAQLSSIPSAEYESEEEDSPPPSHARKKQPPSQLH